MPSCRIIVPIYRPLSAAEYAVVKHNLAMLQDFPVALIGGQGQSALLAETRDELAAKSGSNVTVETFEDRFFQNVAGYNQLLTEPAFYQRFAVEDYVLICQQDAIVLKPELQDWLEKQFKEMKRRDARGLALGFVGALEGSLLLARLQGDPKIVKKGVEIYFSK